MLEDVKKIMNKDDSLSIYACKNSDAIRFDMELESKHIDAFLVQASSTKVAVFMFVNETDMNYMNNMIAISIGK